MSGQSDNRGRGSRSGAMETGNACDTRHAILKSARNLFLHYGFKKTTIDEIAQDAGVGKGTVYLYFDNKEEILLTIAREVKKNVTEQMRAIVNSMASPEEKLRRMILAKIVAVHDAVNTTAHGLEMVDEMMRPHIRQCGMDEHQIQQTLMAAVLEEGVEHGDFTLHTSADQVAHLFALAFISFLPPYMTGCHGAPCRTHLETQVDAMLGFLLNGLRRRN